jgi:hypothetical protein
VVDRDPNDDDAPSADGTGAEPGAAALGGDLDWGPDDVPAHLLEPFGDQQPVAYPPPRRSGASALAIAAAVVVVLVAAAIAVVVVRGNDDNDVAANSGGTSSFLHPGVTLPHLIGGARTTTDLVAYQPGVYSAVTVTDSDGSQFDVSVWAGTTDDLSAMLQRATPGTVVPATSAGASAPVSTRVRGHDGVITGGCATWQETPQAAAAVCPRRGAAADTDSLAADGSSLVAVDPTTFWSTFTAGADPAPDAARLGSTDPRWWATVDEVSPWLINQQFLDQNDPTHGFTVSTRWGRNRGWDDTTFGTVGSTVPPATRPATVAGLPATVQVVRSGDKQLLEVRWTVDGVNCVVTVTDPSRLDEALAFASSLQPVNETTWEDLLRDERPQPGPDEMIRLGPANVSWNGSPGTTPGTAPR